MKEMNESMVSKTSTMRKKKKGSGAVSDVRVISSSSSRPRSQMAMTNS